MVWHAAVGANSSSVFGSFVDLGGFGLVLIDESRASVAAGVRDCLALAVVSISMFITKQFRASDSYFALGARYLDRDLGRFG